MDDATWTALTLTVVLTTLGAAGTWLAFRRRGLPAGLLGLAITLLFPAAYLTRTLRMFADIAGSVASWATSLVFSPSVWIGIVLAGTSVVLFATSRALGARELGTRGTPRRAAVPDAGSTRAVSATGAREPAVDDDLADIEAILRKRGIS